ncbi:MAG: biofilm regulation diguanylate cyclase SiaD [Gammaproteobacteria bacterium SHHR-1]|uniref:biofilm regulation diguanylate cyclase SiaD n=1 Tax=Magnetovirga frankeli TaxID=947516 RepID=UPI001293D7ED|nr:GGDEF domain-containing protein [gamma proteobacterium SS-5]
MTKACPSLHTEQELFARIRSLLDDTAQANNPLHDPLAELLQLSQTQNERLQRLVRISDGYHEVGRRQTETLTQQYDRQLRRLEKLARISDRYQNSLRQLSEALKVAALQDPLTGLGNRRYLMERLREESERVVRKGNPYALGLIDVDHFKTFNDRFGHEVGDRVLCEISQSLHLQLRDYDLCGRWGGEEFLIILPESDLAEAGAVAERVLQAIKEIHLEDIDSARGLTASMGLSLHQAGENYSETIRRADDALYRAKELGRDRLEIAP